MGGELCVLYGPVIGVVVSLLKKIPFVGKNPKVAAAVLAVVATLLSVQGWQQHAKEIVVCIVIALGGAVGTYEVAIKPFFGKSQPPM